ncbi:DNA sulfur modification protein DndB [Neobacillus mesonae]|uniref:DNA sulfur modification protein DndB n=1 Tax=Neobacillus mesonae TaxID=1193713 RepID=UPI00083544E5|nr:DNA sulfur modification protein DndB [Neobacillus mesonae]
MIVNDVFSKRQSIATYTIQELSVLIKNGQVTLREVDKLHVRAIKKYILENVLTEQIYFPPMVANVACIGVDKPLEMTIIDGNQRLKAFCQIEEMGCRTAKSDHEEEMKRGYKLLHFVQNTEVAIQLFEGLTKEEADQLFIDLNTKGKKVALSKRIAFDSRKELNKITNSILRTNRQLKTAGVEIEKRAVVRPMNKKLLSLSHLRQLVAIFLTGKMVYRTVDDRYEAYLEQKEYIQLINTWLSELFKLYRPERIGDLQVSMLASHPLLASIAYYANKGLEISSFEERKQELINRMRSLQKVDWKSTNPIWKSFKGTARGGFYYLTNDKENIHKLVKWLEQQGGE